MIKKFFLTASLAAMASCAAVPVMASSKEELCLKGANLYMAVAEGRDVVSPETAYKALLSMGISPDLALSIIGVVYITRSNVSPQDIGADFYNYCVSEPA